MVKLKKGWYTIIPIGNTGQEEVEQQHARMAGKRIYVNDDIQEFRCGQDSLGVWEHLPQNKHLRDFYCEYIFFCKGLKPVSKIYKYKGEEYV